MDRNTYLNRYQICTGPDGSPVALHRGPSGVTFRAEDIETDQPVALKLMPTYSFELAELQQLEGEARAAQQVNHPNIARLYDFGLSGGDVIFVTELLDGTTLDAWVGEHGPLPAAAVLRIAMQVASGLAAAAFHSVVHRAIQPANLMIVPGQTPEGEWPLVKVLNFGGVPPTLSNSAVSFGQGGPSPQFASPEQLEGKPADFRSELYSLGCTMWFLLTGVPPTPGAVDKGGRVPKPLRPLLAQLVALDPMERPQDPVVLQGQLAECLAVVERKGTFARKVAAPIAAVATAPARVPDPTAPPVDQPIIAHDEKPLTAHTALLKPLALAAAVVLFIGLAGIAWSYLRSHSNTAEVGVPVGVPDASATPTVAGNNTTVVTNTAETAPSPAAAVAANNTATSSATTSAPTAATPNAPTVVSVQPAEPVDTAANETTAPAVANGAAEPATVAANDSPTANETAEPQSPGEGPAATLVSAPPQPTAAPVVAQNSSDGNEDTAPKTASTAQSSRTSKAAAPVRKPATTEDEADKAPRVAKATPKRTERVAHTEVRAAQPVDNDDAPPVPRGATRAKYLGTTPQGDLIFGLPSEQRGYVAPPTYGGDHRRVRRARPVAEPPAEETALPAEPVDE